MERQILIMKLGTVLVHTKGVILPSSSPLVIEICMEEQIHLPTLMRLLIQKDHENQLFFPKEQKDIIAQDDSNNACTLSLFDEACNFQIQLIGPITSSCYAIILRKVRSPRLYLEVS